MKFTAVILAGGRSSRMEQDKADLRLPRRHGEPSQTLLELMTSIVRQAGAETILVNRNKTGFLNDEYVHQGPLAGIHAGLKACEHNELLLFVPVDMPLLNVDLIHALLNEAELKQEPVYFQEQMLPLALINQPEYASHLAQVFASQTNNSIRAFLKHIQAKTLDTEYPEKLISTNTPEQWRQAIGRI
ncbi:molybdenum cofactor guanylyltransferase [Algibacillus agarilyticus]|uniref:molybdenum cofactor guanylyltransferase n=1 Tax=Algibacillus agarilyticus TaxID=2234133 RepID=UPI000DD01CD2|nr:molybdenum cofactor guanylyltransferase [Algibacillus agarilyticus]